MADFVDEEITEKEGGIGGEECDDADIEGATVEKGPPPAEVIGAREPIHVLYCPKCSLPPEFCEYGPSFEECLPWIIKTCPEVLPDKYLAEKMGDASLEDDEAGEKKKKKRGGVAGPKKKAVLEARVVIARVQRQKRKFVTVVTGLETIADLKIKDAAKVFGKKFASGASVSDTATGGKEVVIQGDVFFELPGLLISEFKIPATAIFTQNEDGTVQSYA